MRITPFALAGVLVLGAAAAPASAGPKKPITKSYEATAPTPDPTNFAGSANVPGYSVCAQRVPNSFHLTEFKAPAAGKIKVQLTNFSGDWDMLLMDSKNTEVANAGEINTATPTDPQVETATAKLKKKGAVIKIVVCNWAGGPTGTVKYTFTYS